MGAEAVGFGPDASLWVAGDGGEVFRREGGRWVRVGRPEAPAGIELYSATELSPRGADDLLWVALGGNQLGGTVALVSWWDGRSWSPPVTEALAEVEAAVVPGTGGARWVQLMGLERWVRGARERIAGVPPLTGLAACPDGSVVGLAEGALWTVSASGRVASRRLPEGHEELFQVAGRIFARVRCTAAEVWVSTSGAVYRTAR